MKTNLLQRWLKTCLAIVVMAFVGNNAWATSQKAGTFNPPTVNTCWINDSLNTNTIPKDIGTTSTYTDTAFYISIDGSPRIHRVPVQKGYATPEANFARNTNTEYKGRVGIQNNSKDGDRGYILFPKLKNAGKIHMALSCGTLSNTVKLEIQVNGVPFDTISSTGVNRVGQGILKDTATFFTIDINRPDSVQIKLKNIAGTGIQLWWIAVEKNASTPDTDNPILAGKDSIQPLGNNIATSTNEFVLKFNEDVKAGTGYALLYKSDDTHVDSLDIATATINGKNVTFTLNAGKQLTTATSYYLKVDADAITDMANNKFAGINDKTTWSFTTSASLSNEKKLTALTIKGQRGNTRYSNDSVFISVPPTAKMNSLVVASIEISDAATDSVAGKYVAKDSLIDCRADVAIKITAQNGSDTTYWLRVSNAADTQNELLTFKIGSTNGIIRNDSVLVTLPASTTDLTALVATFTKSQYATVYAQDSLQTSGTTANDFTNTVIYKVKSEAGANHEYKVVVSIAPKPQGLIFEESFNYTPGTDLVSNGWTKTPGSAGAGTVEVVALIMPPSNTPHTRLPE